MVYFSYIYFYFIEPVQVDPEQTPESVTSDGKHLIRHNFIFIEPVPADPDSEQSIIINPELVTTDGILFIEPVSGPADPEQTTTINPESVTSDGKL